MYTENESTYIPKQISQFKRDEMINDSTYTMGTQRDNNKNSLITVGDDVIVVRHPKTSDGLSFSAGVNETLVIRFTEEFHEH